MVRFLRRHGCSRGHGARGALRKPSLHETGGREFRLWRLVELAAAALSASNERIDGGSARANGKLGVCGPPGLLATDFVNSIARGNRSDVRVGR